MTPGGMAGSGKGFEVNSPPRIRDAVPGDFREITALARQLGYECRESDIRERISMYAADPDRRLMTADIDGRAAAWVSLELVRHLYLHPYVDISGFVVDSGLRGRGIGALLISEAERWTRDKGCGVLRLNTNTIRTDAHRFYERCGFSRLKSQHVYTKAISAG